VLPFFVIGLREGVEASLIVGVIAAFLAHEQRTDALRRMWLGVAGAVVLCIGLGIGLEIINENLPQRQQEMLETVIALVAIVMISYMILFMRRHARSMKADLRSKAGLALASGSASALVLMAFLAVLREGFETAVFLVASFDASHSRGASVLGAFLGIVVACVIGWLIYRGGMRVNLARFFTITALVLVIIAAGLAAFAAHTAHEAGWLHSAQTTAFDAKAFVKPGSIRSALITGVFGIQPKPVWAEVYVWVVYLVPMTLVVLWPRRTAPRAENVHAVSAVSAA
jgi:high-affinity iron transporter